MSVTRSKRISVVLVLAVAAGGIGVWYTAFASADDSVAYRFVNVESGDIERVVSSTGTLEAVTTVQVGTQVSGIVSEILADFNDGVDEGQVIARIDPTILESTVRDAETTLARNLAQLRQAQSENSRTESLWSAGLASEIERETAQYALEVAQQAVNSAEIALERARQNLSYATIYAPISGTVIERNVDVGQTVAASLSAPQLFLIADDLSRMQMLASVDESDIGLLRHGQAARFTVQAYPDAEFAGVVSQVRLQSTVQDSVVTYTVVVDVDNRDRRLLPGMTATVDFVVETAEDVLKVPNAALRFTPTEEVLAAAQQARASGADGGRSPSRSGEGLSASSSGEGRSASSPKASAGAGSGASGSRIWYLDEGARLTAARVRVGISDGQWTEIRGAEIQGAEIHAGMQVVAGVVQQASSVANPFQSTSTQSRPPRGPGF